MPYSQVFKSGTHTYNMGQLNDIAVTATTVTGTDPYTIQFSGAPDLSRIFANDLFLDNQGYRWKIVTVDNTAKSITVTNSEYDSGTPYTGTGTVGRWFSTISAFYTERKGNLVSDNRNEICACYNDGSDTVDAPEFNASTCDATHFFTVTSPVGERHTGVAGSGFRLNGGSLQVSGGLITTDDDYMVVEWLEIMHYKANTVGVGPFKSDVKDWICHDCIIHDETEGGTTASIYVDYIAASFRAYNNICYGNGWYQMAVFGSVGTGVYGHQVFNNTFSRPGGDVIIGNYILAINNIFDGTSATVAAGSDYNIGTTFLPTGAHSQTILATNLHFLNYAGLDFRVADNTQAAAQGNNMSTVFTNDIRGHTRPPALAWTVGADEIPIIHATTGTLAGAGAIIVGQSGEKKGSNFGIVRSIATAIVRPITGGGV